MTRLFVALNIPEEIKKQIIILRNSILPNTFDYRWEPEKKLHITLKFIGNVEDELVQSIAVSLKFLENYNKVNCSFTKFGFFYKNGQVKILWLSLSLDPHIFELVTQINHELQKFSVPVDNRKFKAHLTLNRLKGNEGKKFIEYFQNTEIPALKFVADEISLIKSELSHSGSIYSEVERYYLGRNEKKYKIKNIDK